MKGQITHEHLAAIKQAGGVTFTPLHRKRYRCNQAPGLGPLHIHELETVRSQAFALLHEDENPPKRSGKKPVAPSHLHYQSLPSP